MSMFSHELVDDELVQDVLARKNYTEFSVHGLQHWQKVERNGLYLAQKEGGDRHVISLFALFHDSQRLNEFKDPDHGIRGAKLAEEFYDAGRLGINSEQFTLLTEACRDHTKVVFHDDVTIQCCWDGDRLDLRRVSIIPEAVFLNTKKAKHIAEAMDYSLLDGFTE